MTVRVFDPPMCCTTGVCGTDVDPALARFAADLEWIREQGVAVERIQLTTSPDAFCGTPAVKERIEREGIDCLPIVVAGECVVASGAYPSRAKLAKAAGLTASGVDVLPSSGASGCCGPSGCC